MAEDSRFLGAVQGHRQRLMRAMNSEPPRVRPVRPRRLLRAALKGAAEAGAKVRRATLEQGKVTIELGDDTTPEANEWDERLSREEKESKK
jgi:hypothetical protein